MAKIRINPETGVLEQQDFFDELFFNSWRPVDE